MQTAWYVGAGFLAVGYIVTRLWMTEGKQEGVE